MNKLIIDVGDSDFEAAVIERSKTTPVVVDFWAPWCGPCKALGPLLERLTTEYAGQFILAKVNTDENPALSQALRIQSIPMVVGFRDGQVVADFVGAIPEPALREFLAKVLPSEIDRLVETGVAALSAGNLDDAATAFQTVLTQDPRRETALLGLAQVQAQRGNDEEALLLLERINPGLSRNEADRLTAEIRIRQGGGQDETALRALLAENPNDLEARLHLAQVLAAASRYHEALEELLAVVRRDRQFQDAAARKAMLNIFDLLGPGNELVDTYRAELAKVLFS